MESDKPVLPPAASLGMPHKGPATRGNATNKIIAKGMPIAVSLPASLSGCVSNVAAFLFTATTPANMNKPENNDHIKAVKFSCRMNAASVIKSSKLANTWASRWLRDSSNFNPTIRVKTAIPASRPSKVRYCSQTKPTAISVIIHKTSVILRISLFFCAAVRVSI